MPLELEINTLKQVFEIRAGKIFKAGITAGETTIGVYLQFPGWRKYFSLLPPGTGRKKTKKRKPAVTGKRRPKRIKNMPRKMLAVLKTFKVKQLELNIDTGDYVTNAYLYPVFYMIKLKTRRNTAINFNGENYLVLHMQNNLWRMGWAFLR